MKKLFAVLLSAVLLAALGAVASALELSYSASGFDSVNFNDSGTAVMQVSVGKPFQINLTAEDAKGVVSWALSYVVANNDGSNMTSYTDNGGPLQLSSTTGTTVTITGTLQEGMGYSGAIIATDGYSNVSASGIVTSGTGPGGGGSVPTPSPSNPGGNNSKSTWEAQLSRLADELGITARGERIIGSAGPITATSTGVRNYSISINQNEKPGYSLFGYLATVDAATGSISSVRLTAIKTPPTLYGDNGSETDIIPQSRIVTAAANMTAGETYAIILTTNPSILPVAILEPAGELSEDIIQNIANTLSIDVDKIIVSTRDNVSFDKPQEPTEGMRKVVADEGYSFSYKFDTVTVSEDGYYVFKVTIPDELLSVDVKDLAITALGQADYPANGDTKVRVAFLPVLNGLGALLDGKGFGLNETGQHILALLTLQAGEPFSVYLLKIILTILLGGCNAGVGLGVLGFAVVGGVLMARRWRKKQ